MRAPSAADQLWIFSARADLLLFTLPAACALGLVLASPEARSGESPEWLWVGGILLVDVAHVWSTAFLTYLSAAELRRHPWRYGLIPAVAWGLGVGAYAAGGAPLFWRCLAYLAVFHFVRQQYGWMALYRARAQDASRFGAVIDGVAIYAATLYPLIYWHAHLPRRFDWFLPGDFATGVPAVLSPVAAAGYAGSLGAYVLRASYQWYRGRNVPWGKHLLLVTTAATWYAGIVATNADYAFTLCNVFVHGIPYAALVFSYGRHVGAKERSLAARLLGGGAGSAALRFLGCLWLFALLEELFWDRAVWQERSELFGPALDWAELHTWLVPLLALPQVSHYVLDGLFWRRAHNPHLRSWFTGTGAHAASRSLAQARPSAQAPGQAPGATVPTSRCETPATGGAARLSNKPL